MHNIFDALDYSQKNAVFHSHGPALVVAGPGSGKTTVILGRVWYLISQCQIPPEHILVLTFTKAAASSLQDRLFSFTNNKYVPVSFGTFHSFIYQILRQYGSYKDSSIITTKEKQELLTEIGLYDRSLHKDILHAFSYRLNNPSADIRPFLPAGVSMEMFDDIFRKYLHLLKQDNLLDFDQMAELILRLFDQSPFVLSILQNQYIYILVDEFQDTNPYQYEMLKRLSGNAGQLFAVGDDDQAIYSFRGSFPSIMQQFTKDFQTSTTYYLQANYRSDREIVKVAGKLISENKDRLWKDFISSSVEEGEINYLSFTDHRAEYQYVLSRLRKLSEEYNWNELAVIARTNKQLEQILVMLRQENIPFLTSEKIGFVKNGVEKDILDLLLYISGDRSKIRLWRKIVKESDREPAFWKNKPPGLFMQYLIHGTNYVNYIREREVEQENAILHALIKESMKHKSITSFADHIKFKMTMPKYDEGVGLLTMHGAKGLEFSCVVLIDINEGVIPGKGNMSIEQLEEERRMLYVGMTRAKKILDVCYLKGTKEHPRFVSRFLNPLLQNAGED